MIQNLPEPSIRFLCVTFDGRPSLTSHQIVQELGAGRSAQFFGGSRVVNDGINLVHASAGEHYFTRQGFFETVARLNAD
jgi:hypothetical protein